MNMQKNPQAQQAPSAGLPFTMPMRVYLRKTSLVDYPGRVAAVLFLPGCNLRCPWCQNRDLVIPGGDGGPGLLPLEEALAHIAKRRSLLGGLVLSGGEPCLYPGLAGLIGRVKAFGLPVKLDTNGTAPAALAGLLAREESRPGYIALDLKLAPERYGEIIPRSGGVIPGETTASGAALKESAALIRRSGIPHEFRTLSLPRAHITGADIEALAPLADGAPWYFRPFRPGNCLDPAWDRLEPPGREAAEALARKARELGKNGISLDG
jgi:pyruvate formate lyase activating enzyme